MMVYNRSWPFISPSLTLMCFVVISCTLVTINARFLHDGHLTVVPAHETYDSKQNMRVSSGEVTTSKSPTPGHPISSTPSPSPTTEDDSEDDDDVCDAETDEDVAVHDDSDEDQSDEGRCDLEEEKTGEGESPPGNATHTSDMPAINGTRIKDGREHNNVESKDKKITRHPDDKGNTTVRW